MFGIIGKLLQHYLLLLKYISVISLRAFAKAFRSNLCFNISENEDKFNPKNTGGPSRPPRQFSR